ncbi:MAG: hypothetical protein QM765_36820 [Myxococcales bacterium]
MLQTQVPLNAGNSRGLIFNRQGHGVGIVTAGIKEASAINFGIAMDIALRSLPQLSRAGAGLGASLGRLPLASCDVTLLTG